MLPGPRTYAGTTCCSQLRKPTWPSRTAASLSRVPLRRRPIGRPAGRKTRFPPAAYTSSGGRHDESAPRFRAAKLLSAQIRPAPLFATSAHRVLADSGLAVPSMQKSRPTRWRARFHAGAAVSASPSADVDATASGAEQQRRRRGCLRRGAAVLCAQRTWAMSSRPRPGPYVAGKDAQPHRALRMLDRKSVV